MAGVEYIMDMMNELNEWELKQLVLKMSEQLGDNRSMNVLNSMVDVNRRYTKEMVMKTVHSALSATDTDFFSGPVGEFRYCNSIGDFAYTLAMDALDGACRKDVARLLACGRKGDAYNYIRWMLLGLDSARCAITEHMPDCGRILSERFKENLENGDPLRGFDH